MDIRNKKIGFIIPWYGENIPGGAEMALRGITSHLYKEGIDLEILTTCVKQFTADWSENFHKPGVDNTCKVPVRRFKARKRDNASFDTINLQLMKGLSISKDQEQVFMEEMVNSPELYDYIKEHSDEYSCFISIPYMFGTTYYSMKACPEKAVMIPCLHEESYSHMELFKELFPTLRGCIYLAQPEMDLANRIYDMSTVKQAVLGTGIDTDMKWEKGAFAKKFNITEPFILYAGRKTEGKNVDVLLRYFAEYKLRNRRSKLKLVLIGGDTIAIPESVKNDVYDLGFVDIQDKFNAYGDALLLCQPSTHESFSLVIMESWLCERPVLVADGCDVTKNFANVSNAGLYFKDYFEFEGCLDYFVNHPEEADVMGKNGREFVLNNFAWDVVTQRYIEFLENL